MKTLTLEWLKDHGACEDKVAIFAKLFPDGMKFTLENCRKLEKAGIDEVDFNWLFTTILTGKGSPCVMWGYLRYNKTQLRIDTPEYFMRCLRKMWKEEQE